MKEKEPICVIFSPAAWKIHFDLITEDKEIVEVRFFGDCTTNKLTVEYITKPKEEINDLKEKLIGLETVQMEMVKTMRMIVDTMRVFKKK